MDDQSRSSECKERLEWLKEASYSTIIYLLGGLGT